METQPRPSSTPNTLKAIQDALDANKKLQEVLSNRAEQLEAQLSHVDELLRTADINEAEDDPQSEVVIPGAKKASGLFPSNEFLSPNSPFYDEAQKRSSFIANTSPHPMKPKDFEVLANAVRQENKRLQACREAESFANSGVSTTPIDVENNVDGLDWTRISEKVSDASSVKRTPIDCKVAWIGDRHPRINHAEWTPSEVNELNTIVLEDVKDKRAIDWVKVAKTLGTNRTPIDCLRHGPSLHRHTWSPETDKQLLKGVESCGMDNWQLVAKTVSEQVTAAQCQGRWQKTLNPALKRGAWTAEEDERLRKAVAGYGKSWIQVATAVAGRTNDQCRERWTEHINQAVNDVTWSEEEDKNLLTLVEGLGKQWKAVRIKIGNGKTVQNCRLRYEKLQKMQQERAIQDAPSTAAVINSTSANNAGPSRVGQIENPNGGTSTFTFTSNMEQEHTSQPSGSTTPTETGTRGLYAGKLAQKGKGKGKGKLLTPVDAASENNIPGPVPATIVSPNDTGNTTEPAVPRTKPRPRPKPRKKAVSNDSQQADKDVNQVPTLAQKSSEPAASLSTPDVVQAPSSTRARKRKATESLVNDLDKKSSKKSKKAKEGPEGAESTGLSHVAGALPAATASSTTDVDMDGSLGSEPASAVQQLRRGRSRKLAVPVEPVEIPTPTTETEKSLAKRSRGRRSKA